MRECVSVCVSGCAQADAVTAVALLSRHKPFFVELMMSMELSMLKPTHSPVLVGALPAPYVLCVCVCL
ncbi:MAG: hypothetical protein P4L40_13690 [Terracidiphilus sp.]|nr:hypothetical protein [Terracidiphilus sp.]